MKLKLAKEIPPFFPAQVFSETTLGFLMLVANDIVLITRYIQERKAKLLTVIGAFAGYNSTTNCPPFAILKVAKYCFDWSIAMAGAAL